MEGHSINNSRPSVICQPNSTDDQSLPLMAGQRGKNKKGGKEEYLVGLG